MDVSPRRLAESVAELVRIPSVNPLHAGPIAEAAGPIGELAIAHHLAARFDRCGASEVILDDVLDGRPNVYGWFPGRSDRIVVVDVHTDTVTVEHMTDPPFDGRIDDGHVWGRGALDTKATMGVLLALLEGWRDDAIRPDPTLLLVGSISEEAGGLLGAVRFSAWAAEQQIEIDQMVVAEPTELAPIHGHKGGSSLRVTALGVAAHSARPELGSNAIEAMAPVIEALHTEHERLQTLTPSTDLGNPTLSVTMIEGGSGGNVIPAHCTITVSRRVVPGEDSTDVYEHLAALAADACGLPTEVEPAYGRRPDGGVGLNAFYQEADSALVRDLAAWAGTEPAVAPFGTNALAHSGRARELTVFGPGCIDDAHQATECVAIDDLVALAEVYTRWLDPG